MKITLLLVTVYPFKVAFHARKFKGTSRPSALQLMQLLSNIKQVAILGSTTSVVVKSE